MRCDKCFSPAHCSDVLSDSASHRLGTDNSKLVKNISHSFFDKTNIYVKKVTSLEREIASIETVMAQFAQRRVFLRRKMNGLSPTARIPSDILIKIFQIACQPVYKNNFRSRQAVTPLFIGSICKLWRDVAWSTPLVWDTIFLHISRKHHGTQVQLLRDWLLNARSALLSIKLTAEDEHESVLCAFEEILGILVTRSDYWLTFDSRIPPPQCPNIFKNINFPMLTSVSLRNPASTPNIPDMFLTSPKLVDITLLRYNFPVVLPWEQVRRFRTARSTVTECLKVLRQSPNLQKCRFEYVYAPDSLISIMPHVQLKHLHVGLKDSETSMSLLDSITLPSLSELRIQYNGSKRLLLSSITSLVLRSACNLERFTMGIRFDYADLVPCLEAIPSLTFLHLEMLIGPDRGLTKLVASLDPLSNSSRLLLPNLKYFKYRGPVLCDCRTIVDMLVHRWHLSDDVETSRNISTRVSKLQQAEILSTFAYHVTTDVQEELRNLSEEGMVVRIESHAGN